MATGSANVMSAAAYRSRQYSHSYWRHSVTNEPAIVLLLGTFEKLFLDRRRHHFVLQAEFSPPAITDIMELIEETIRII